MINKKFSEIVEILIYVAKNSGTGRVSAKELASALGISYRHHEKTMQHLVHEGILVSSKGVRGGYSLAKEKRKTTLADIYKSYKIGGESDFIARDSVIMDKVIEPALVKIEQNLVDNLKKITLEQLCQALPREQKPDFNI